MMIKRQIYPENTPLADALAKWMEVLSSQGLLQPLAGETISVDDALGRITAEAVAARSSSPTYHASAMDGVAVRSADTLGTSETSPKQLKIGRDALFVDTGDPLPAEMDAVIMIEDVDQTGEAVIEIIAPATPYQHVRTLGEDIVATELILPENHKIRPMDMGAMLAGGVTEISVRRSPVVEVVPTGDELVQPGSDVTEGKIIEFNSRILCGQIREWGGRAIRSEIVRDDLEVLKTHILSALDRSDLVVINAGSSAGKQDYTVHALRELGEVFVHGINIRPGKPVILGLVKGKPVVGIPGYPVSAVLTLDLFVKPVIYAMQGLSMPEPEVVKALLSRPVASALGQEEFLRVKVGVVGENLIATPISRGAGMLMSLVRADGIIRVPPLSEGIAPRQHVTVHLIRSRREIEKTLVCIGSHDNSLDILANLLKKRYPEMSLSSAHVGSMGGLLAVKRGEAHLAGTHLLDEESGEYNVPFVRRLLPDRKIVLVNLVYRQQGFVVQKGNPKGITVVQDLCRKDVTFINRQKGSGTRLLTDKHLRESGVDPAVVRGYEREEYTHMGVASAVAGGTADTGVGILTAAIALDLDFVPLARERYDFVIPLEFYETEGMERLLGILREDQAFKSILQGLGGYEMSDMGRVMYEG
jgi:putative molybdopterin biosynthesis protein